jgi:putative transposase
MGLIDKDTDGLSIVRQCELLALSRSNYYYQPSQETEENLLLMRKMDELHLEHPYYGVLRMQAELTTAENLINEKRIRRLMRKMGIEALYPKPNTSKPCPWNKRFPYLLRELKIERANQIWSTDITYIPMKNGFMYLCAIIDWHSKYLLSWQLSNTMSVSFCIDCLEEAVQSYGIPEIINTDQGSQFTSDSFIEKVLGYNIRLSMDGKGRATDNVCIERFWRSIKYEKIYLHGYDNNIELFLGITEYVNFYNNRRKHQSLDYQTPSCVYTGSEVLA